MTLQDSLAEDLNITCAKLNMNIYDSSKSRNVSKHHANNGNDKKVFKGKIPLLIFISLFNFHKFFSIVYSRFLDFNFKFYFYYFRNSIFF